MANKAPWGRIVGGWVRDRRLLAPCNARGFGVRMVRPVHCPLVTPQGATMSLLMILLLVFFVLAVGGAGWGHSRFGYVGWSPAAIILVVFGVLYFTGSFR